MRTLGTRRPGTFRASTTAGRVVEPSVPTQLGIGATGGVIGGLLGGAIFVFGIERFLPSESDDSQEIGVSEPTESEHVGARH